MIPSAPKKTLFTVAVLCLLPACGSQADSTDPTGTEGAVTAGSNCYDNSGCSDGLVCAPDDEGLGADGAPYGYCYLGDHCHCAQPRTDQGPNTSCFDSTTCAVGYYCDPAYHACAQQLPAGYPCITLVADECIPGLVCQPGSIPGQYGALQTNTCQVPGDAPSVDPACGSTEDFSYCSSDYSSVVTCVGGSAYYQDCDPSNGGYCNDDGNGNVGCTY
jgi:hypothetical protein